jgi:thiamine kinase-like enzyme
MLAMSIPLHEALEMVPLWKGQQLETHELSGGLTNRNYRVRCGEATYVLRLPGSHTSRLLISRQNEQAATVAASRAGLSPAVYFADAERGVLVSAHVAGQHWGNEQISEGDNLTKLVQALRGIHSLTVELPRFDPMQLAAQYRQQLLDMGQAPSDAIWFARVVDLQRSLSQCRHPVVCHNDVVRSNFIDDGRRLWFIDWECAGLNDPYYDLAIVSHNNRLSLGDEQQLLFAYFPGATDVDRARLACMKILHDVYHVYWYALQLALAAPSGQAIYRQGYQHHASRLCSELEAMAV